MLRAAAQVGLGNKSKAAMLCVAASPLRVASHANLTKQFGGCEGSGLGTWIAGLRHQIERIEIARTLNGDRKRGLDDGATSETPAQQQDETYGKTKTSDTNI